MSEVQLFLGDCLEILPTLMDNSVNAVITDPPYFEINEEDWDHQWENLSDYIYWLSMIADEWKRILKDNGSLYVFCDDKTRAYIQVMLDQKFLLLNDLVWYKPNNLPIKTVHSLRSYAPMTERILFYTCQYDATGWQSVMLDINSFKSLRNYFKNAYNGSGRTYKEINNALGTANSGGGMASHYFGDIGQWTLPTFEQYKKLQNIMPDNLRREYEDLRREYEDLRRVFNSDGKTLDVIECPIINSKENTDHPTTKPLYINKRFTLISSNPGDTILDSFMGSGTTGVACVQTGRKFIGIEIEPKYFEIAETRIKEAQMQLRMPF